MHELCKMHGVLQPKGISEKTSYHEGIYFSIFFFHAWGLQLGSKILIQTLIPVTAAEENPIFYTQYFHHYTPNS